MQLDYNSHNKEKGSTLIYAMMVIALFLIAYAAYFFATLTPTNPYDLKNKYEQLYIGDQKDINQSDFSYEQDLYEQFGNRVENYQNDSKSDGTVPRYIGDPVPAQEQVAPQEESVEGQSVVPTIPATQEKDSGATGEGGQSLVPYSDTILLDDTYTSTANNRITFPIPKGIRVKETGTSISADTGVNTDADTDADATSKVKEGGRVFTFSIKEKDFTITIKKVSVGCFDPLISFAIPSGIGVDYRILYMQKEIALSNTYRAVIGTEEYGTYKGKFGYRGTSCVQSAIPTMIDLRTAGWKKAEQTEVLRVMEEILSKMTV